MAKPNLALIPAAQGSKLFSVLPSSGVGDFDFSRSGKATRINSQGLIEEVSNGQSRLNYPMIDGKVVGCPHHILEPQSTNRQSYSEDLISGFSNGATSVSSNVIISPDGALNADKLVESNTNARHELYGATISFSGTTSVSFFAKASERRYISVFIGGNPAVGGATFDVEDGVVSLMSGGTDASIVNYGNGWYRCSLTSTNAGSYQVYYCLRTNASAVDVQTYQGDGTSGMYLWGFQTEVGQSYPTSYIPTNGESGGVTRSAETANGSGDAATFNDSEGVLMAEISALAEDSGLSRRITISDGSTNNRLSIELDETEGLIKVFFTGNGTLNQLAKNISDVYTPFKILASYELNSLKLYINGYKRTEDTSIVLPNGLDDLSFDSGTGSSNFYGKTKQIQYYNSALTDSELEQLTSWTSFTDMAQGQLYTIE